MMLWTNGEGCGGYLVKEEIKNTRISYGNCIKFHMILHSNIAGCIEMEVVVAKSLIPKELNMLLSVNW